MSTSILLSPWKEAMVCPNCSLREEREDVLGNGAHLAALVGDLDICTRPQVLLVDLQPGIESHQIGWYDTPENQLGPHTKTSPRSAFTTPITLASQPVSETRAFDLARPKS